MITRPLGGSIIPGRLVDDFSRKVEEFGGRRVKESEVIQ